MGLDSTIWGPPMWFFLHTSAMCYPLYPNAVTKKKYYDFFQNLPLFIPIEPMSSHFSRLLEEYPLSPYLDDRESITRWVWFIHNKINEKLEKPPVSLSDFYVKYYEAYQPKNNKRWEYVKIREKWVYTGFLLLLLGVIYYYYDK
jgi:hypothetical protein